MVTRSRLPVPYRSRARSHAAPLRGDFITRDAAIDERDHPNGVRHHARIVRREDERHAMPVPKVAHHVHEDFGVLSIEIRGRLVGEDGAGRAAIARATATLLLTA